MADFRLSKTTFVGICRNRDINQDYEFKQELGSGAYGVVYLAIDKATGEKRAIKAMNKDQIDDKEALENELAILKSLDHPNIVKLFEVYEFKNNIYLVTELCEGGELFYHITKTKHLTEAQAAKIMRQIFSAISYLHSKKICHRDLKPENFLLKWENDDSSIKLIDFGLSKKLKDNELMTDPNGTPFYIAPEILDGEYTEAVDNWSLGVILYIMLSGSPPFYGKDNREILKAVQKGVYTLSLKPFIKCSIEVKDLISKLLVKNINKRYTAAMAYNHPWVQQQVEQESKDLTIDVDVIQKIEEFLESQELKKAILLYVAQQIPEKEVQHLRNLFVKIDKNGNGTLSLEEFTNAFGEFQQKIGIKQKLSNEEIEKLFKAIDANNNGVIDYSEFVAIFAEHYIFKTEKYLRMAFEKFDLDKNGKINAMELRNILGGGSIVSLDKVEKIIKQADINGDGELDYNEVLKYIKTSKGKLF
jgi:calcium-dependent protein kinase